MFSTQTLQSMIDLTSKAVSALRTSLEEIDQRSDEFFPQEPVLRHQLSVKERRLSWLLAEAAACARQ